MPRVRASRRSVVCPLASRPMISYFPSDTAAGSITTVIASRARGPTSSWSPGPPPPAPTRERPPSMADPPPTGGSHPPPTPPARAPIAPPAAKTDVVPAQDALGDETGDVQIPDEN